MTGTWVEAGTLHSGDTVLAVINGTEGRALIVRVIRGSTITRNITLADLRNAAGGKRTVAWGTGQQVFLLHANAAVAA